MINPRRKETPEQMAGRYDSAEFENSFFYEGDDLGVSYTRERTVFKLWAPTAEEVTLVLYSAGNGFARSPGRYAAERIGEAGERGVWTVELGGDCKGVYYLYEISFGGRTVTTVDPYARAVGLDGKRAMVADLAATNPDGWDKDNYCFTGTAEEAIVWEVHVRDFSELESSGMTHKGKYLAFTETDTHLPGDETVPTGVAYLKQLGITHVQLQPIFDFATGNDADPKKGYNWGYDPQNYNAPEGSYSENPYRGETAIRELKELVLALHRAGIGVVMDVVYNHCFDIKTSPLQKTVPYYFFRMYGSEVANGSGCGNEFASERLMARKFMLDSLRYWAEEYHLDGFRFDLMGLTDVETVNEARRMLNRIGGDKRILMYGEPWWALPPSMKGSAIPADKRSVKLWDEGVAYFNDEGRDAVKGNTFRAEEPGFVAGAAGCSERLLRMAMGLPKPSRVVQYTACHDNLTIWDKITETVPGDGSGFDAPELVRIAAAKLAAAAVLCSRGMAFLLAGEEFGRTKHGDGNSYRSPISVNGLEWSRTVRFRELLDYYKGLIRIRKRYLIREDEPEMSVLLEEDRLVGWEFRRGDERIWVILNASSEARTLSLPDGEWQLLADATYADDEPLRVLNGEVTVTARAAGIIRKSAC